MNGPPFGATPIEGAKGITFEQSFLPLARLSHLDLINLSLHNELGKSLRLARRERRLSQGEVARKAGVSRPTVRQLEGGRGNLDSWDKVLRALELILQGRSLPSAQSLGRRVAELRKRRGLSQRSLASLVECSHPTIVALERKGRGRLDVLQRVLDCLGAGATLRPEGEVRAFYEGAALSSAHHGWHTPSAVLEVLYGIFGQFDLDPCSPTTDRRSAPVRARVRFTAEDDGLSLPWFGQVFLNPPYGRKLPNWTAKAMAEIAHGQVRAIVAVLPARPDTRWWHRDIAGHAHISFLRGRLRFGDGEQSAPFPSVLVIWGGTDDQLMAVRVAFPNAWHLSAAGGLEGSCLKPGESMAGQ